MPFGFVFLLRQPQRWALRPCKKFMVSKVSVIAVFLGPWPGWSFRDGGVGFSVRRGAGRVALGQPPHRGVVPTGQRRPLPVHPGQTAPQRRYLAGQRGFLSDPANHREPEYDCSTVYRLVSQSNGQIPRNGLRQTIVLEDVGATARMELELELYQDEPVLRQSLRFGTCFRSPYA
jgi:hypothetical protein